jgi:phenylalanyl-tRNA synthetase beta chain
LKLFEVSDIVLLDPSQERLARNQKNLSCIYANKFSGIEEIRGMLDRLMQVLDVPKVDSPSAAAHPAKKCWQVREESSCETFFPDRRADIYYDGAKIGSFGIVHPEVLGHFDIPFPCSALEINIEPFL